MAVKYGHFDICMSIARTVVSMSVGTPCCSAAGIRFWSENPSQDHRFPSGSCPPAVPDLLNPAAERNLWGCCPVTGSAALQTVLQFSLLKCHLVIVSNTDRWKGLSSMSPLLLNAKAGSCWTDTRPTDDSGLGSVNSPTYHLPHSLTRNPDENQGRAWILPGWWGWERRSVKDVGTEPDIGKGLQKCGGDGQVKG